MYKLSKLIPKLILLLLAFSFLACPSQEKSSIHFFPKPPTRKWIKIEEGLEYLIIKQGAGDFIQKGTSVRAHYTAWYTDGTFIGSSLKKGRAHRFKIGQSRVIKGWELLTPKINKGGEMYLRLSSDYAFGDGKADGVKAFSTVIFGIKVEE